MRKKRNTFVKRTMESRVFLACRRYDEALVVGVPLNINTLRKEIESVESMMPSISLSIPYLDTLFWNNKIQDKINKLNQDFESRRSFLNSIFGSIPSEHTAKIFALQSQIKSYPKITCEIIHFKTLMEAQAVYEKLNNYLVLLKSGIPAAMQRQQDLIDAAILREERKEQKKLAEQERRDRQAALAAAHLGTGRERARSVIPKVRGANKFCPYCSQLLQDNDTHVDHIYPMSRGGLSTEVNMVEVCSTCNLNKSDLTLWEFVQSYGLDWTAITERLNALSKRF